MAVKVIDPEPDPSIKKQIACGNCGVKLKYTPNDVQRRDGSDYGGGPDGKEWVNCPACGKQAIIRSW